MRPTLVLCKCRLVPCCARYHSLGPHNSCSCTDVVHCTAASSMGSSSALIAMMVASLLLILNCTSRLWDRVWQFGLPSEDKYSVANIVLKLFYKTNFSVDKLLLFAVAKHFTSKPKHLKHLIVFLNLELVFLKRQNEYFRNTIGRPPPRKQC